MLKKSLTLKFSLCILIAAFFSACSQPSSNSVTNEDLLRVQNIVGGTEASLSFQKQVGVVGIVITLEGDDEPGVCTGTLISKQIVLTAAHCIAEFGAPIQRIVVVFTSNIKNAKTDDLRLARTGQGHEDFMSAAMTGKGSWNDIALLKLSEESPKNFKTAQLATEEVNKFLKKNAMVVQAGFGRTEANNNDESDSIGTLRMVGNIPLLQVAEDGKELLFKEDGKGSCKGDSGGPAYFKVKGKLMQIGVNSRGVNQQNCLEVGVYTNVLPHLDWIKKTSEMLMKLSDDDLNPPKVENEKSGDDNFKSEPNPALPVSPKNPPVSPNPGDDSSGLI